MSSFRRHLMKATKNDDKGDIVTIDMASANSGHSALSLKYGDKSLIQINFTIGKDWETQKLTVTCDGEELSREQVSGGHYIFQFRINMPDDYCTLSYYCKNTATKNKVVDSTGIVTEAVGKYSTVATNLKVKKLISVETSGY